MLLESSNITGYTCSKVPDWYRPNEDSWWYCNWYLFLGWRITCFFNWINSFCCGQGVTFQWMLRRGALVLAFNTNEIWTMIIRLYVRKMQYYLLGRSTDKQRPGCYWLETKIWTSYNSRANHFQWLVYHTKLHNLLISYSKYNIGADYKRMCEYR